VANKGLIIGTSKPDRQSDAGEGGSKEKSDMLSQHIVPGRVTVPTPTVRTPQVRKPPVVAHVPASRSRPDQNAAWTAALVAFEGARDAYAALELETDRRRDAMEADSPIPDTLIDRECGGYLTTDYLIEHAGWLSFAEKVALVPILHEWQAQRAAARQRHGVVDYLENGDDPSDHAHDSYTAAVLDLLAQTPPDVGGLVVQLRAAINACHLYISEDADDEQTISRFITPAATSLDDGRDVALIYRAALRLAGVDTPAIHAEPFDARAWIADFETAPGRYIDGGPVFREETGGPVTATNPPSDWSAPWYALRRWQQDLVVRTAEARNRRDQP
jgi:hypothetical protein